MFFWCVWCTYAQAPYSIGITFWQGIFPKPLPRTLDFVGIITIGITWWYLHRYQQYRNQNSVTKGNDSLFSLGIVTMLTIILVSPIFVEANAPQEAYTVLFVCGYVTVHCLAIVQIILVGSTSQVHRFCAGISIVMGMMIGFIPTAIWLLIAVLIAIGLKGLLQLIFTVWGLHKPERT